MPGRSRVAPATDEQLALAEPPAEEGGGGSDGGGGSGGIGGMREEKRRRRRFSLTKLQVPSPAGEASRGGDLGVDSPAPSSTRRGRLMQRVRRASLTAIEAVSGKVTKRASSILRSPAEPPPQASIDCRFASCGCEYVGHSEEQLAEHYKLSQVEHAGLIRRALARVEAHNEALRTRIDRGSMALADAMTAVAAAERASRSTNLEVKRLRREVRETAQIRNDNEEVWGGDSLDSRLRSLARPLPGQGKLDTLVAKGRDAIATLDSSANPYKRQRCAVCGCIYTNFTNQIATCARHPGEEDVHGRWTCCQNAFTGLHFNGCVLSVHAARKQLATSAASASCSAHTTDTELAQLTADPAPAPAPAPAVTVKRSVADDRMQHAEWLQSARAKDAIRSVLPPT